MKLHAKRGALSFSTLKNPGIQCAGGMLVAWCVRADVVRDCEDVRLRSRAVVVRGRCIRAGVQQQFLKMRATKPDESVTGEGSSLRDGDQGPSTIAQQKVRCLRVVAEWVRGANGGL